MNRNCVLAAGVVVFAVVLYACGTPDRSPLVSPVMTISPDGGTLPWTPGGKFKVALSVAQPEDGGVICGPATAQLNVLTPTLATGALLSATPALQQKDRCGPYEGLTELSWPEGGEFDVQLKVLGEQLVQHVVMDRPDLAVFPGAETRDIDTVRIPLCIVSTAARGTVTLTTDGGTLSGGSALALDLGPTVCPNDAGFEAARRSYATTELVTQASALSVIAKLDQGPARCSTSHRRSLTRWSTAGCSSSTSLKQASTRSWR